MATNYDGCITKWGRFWSTFLVVMNVMTNMAHKGNLVKFQIMSDYDGWITKWDCFLENIYSDVTDMV